MMDAEPRASASGELVSIGPESEVEKSAVVGYLPGRKIANLQGSIGSRARIRAGTVIYAGTVIGDGLETGHNVVIREENRIGDSFKIWNNSTVDYGCEIGNNVRVHCGVYIAQFTKIEDDVFLAPGVMIANDPHPICTRCMKGPTIKRGAKIGINATLLPHITIGENALVGSGSVVTRSVPPGMVVAGNPAEVIGSVDKLRCKAGILEKPYGKELASPATAMERIPVMKKDRIILILPALNEQGKISKVIDKTKNAGHGLVDEILVIDDGSTDHTADEAREHGARVISQRVNMGVGAAIRTGIEYALDKRFDIVVVMGADDQDNPREIPRVLRPIMDDHFVFVQGSRYVAGGERVNIPLFRWITTGVYSLLFKITMKFPVTDGTNGFRAFRTSIFQDKEINLWQSWLNRYELEPYLYYKVIEKGLAVTDAPVTKSYPEGKVGYTKMVPILDWWSILRPLVYLRFGLRK